MSGRMVALECARSSFRLYSGVAPPFGRTFCSIPNSRAHGGRQPGQYHPPALGLRGARDSQAAKTPKADRHGTNADAVVAVPVDRAGTRYKRLDGI